MICPGDNKNVGFYKDKQLLDEWYNMAEFSNVIRDFMGALVVNEYDQVSINQPIISLWIFLLSKSDLSQCLN